MKQKCMILQKSVIAFRGVLLYDICMKRNADSPINRRCISPLSARLSSCRRDFFCIQKQAAPARGTASHFRYSISQVADGAGSRIAKASASVTVQAEPFAS